MHLIKFPICLLLGCVFLACENADEVSLPEDLHSGVTVSGHVADGAGEYIRLLYSPQYRGNLNPEGYCTQGTRIGNDGTFRFTVEEVTEGGNYTLVMEDNFLLLVLSAGDSLYLNMNPNDKAAALVALGRGAGKINFLRLDQLEYDFEHVIGTQTPREFALRADTVIERQLQALEAIYAEDPNHEVVTGAANRAELEGLITQTPLTADEYVYLNQRLRIQRYTMTMGWLARMANDPELASLPVDFDSEAFRPFNPEEYQTLDQVNDWHLANGLNAILTTEYRKKLSGRADTVVTYGNWHQLYAADFNAWASNYLKQHFNVHIHDTYFGALASFALSIGGNHQPYYEMLDETAGGPYAARLKEFSNLLEEDTRMEYGYETDSLMLDMPKLQVILDRHVGKELLINFWSAQYAGSSIVDNIPLMQDFERRNRGEMKVINVCVDSLQQKNLWAARIMDCGWDADHYFVPIEGNDGLLDAFSSRNLATFCEGGASYALINGEGNIHRELDFPFYKLAEHIVQ